MLSEEEQALNRRQVLTGGVAILVAGSFPRLSLAQDVTPTPSENPSLWPEGIIVQGRREFIRDDLEVRFYARVFPTPELAQLDLDRSRHYHNADWWMEFDGKIAMELETDEDIGSDRWAIRVSDELAALGTAVYLHYVEGNVFHLVEVEYKGLGTEDLDFKPEAEKIAKKHLKFKIGNPDNDRAVLRLIPDEDDMPDGFEETEQEVTRFGPDGLPIRD